MNALEPTPIAASADVWQMERWSWWFMGIRNVSAETISTKTLFFSGQDAPRKTPWRAWKTFHCAWMKCFGCGAWRIDHEQGR